ncbi:D-alanine--D-alanine ligase [Candidatus Daviesbacteria bacterium]|nr:D-alanine--D-alanine ligase [Candidatus Daviesbacteria bacterium]
MAIRVGLFFGGRSTEHEVSVITALGAYEHLDKNKYEVTPIYVSKTGDFYTNPKFLQLKNFKDVDSLLLSSTKINFSKGGLNSGGFFSKAITLDIAFLFFHGSFGEDGVIQGLLEMYKIPYTGFNVMGSAVAMDKVISKLVFQALGFNVAKFVSIGRNDWIKDSKNCLIEIKKKLKFPLIIKPADIGSTIGINRAKTDMDLEFNIEVAAVYSDKILIEEAFEGCIEVNCAALGYNDVIPSLCEMPIRSGETLSYEDKYLKGGKNAKSTGMASLSRKIPAPISQNLTKKIQETTVKIFKALEGCGVARIDYFVDVKKEKFYVNEINSPPGSLAFYLFELLPIGIKYSQLLDRIIEDGLKRFEDQKKTQYIFNSPLLSQMAKAGGIN